MTMDRVEPEQVDRDAAAPFIGDIFDEEMAAGVRQGDDDEDALVQAFARHRLAALSTLPEPSGEVVEGLVGFALLPADRSAVGAAVNCSTPADMDEAERFARLCRSAVMDGLDDDVIGGIRESHISFAKFCLLAALASRPSADRSERD